MLHSLFSLKLYGLQRPQLGGNLLQPFVGYPRARRVAGQALEPDAVLLQVAGHVLTSHALHVHQRQDCLGHGLPQALHDRTPDRQQSRQAPAVQASVLRGSRTRPCGPLDSRRHAERQDAPWGSHACTRCPQAQTARPLLCCAAGAAQKRQARTRCMTASRKRLFSSMVHTRRGRLARCALPLSRRPLLLLGAPSASLPSSSGVPAGSTPVYK